MNTQNSNESFFLLSLLAAYFSLEAILYVRKEDGQCEKEKNKVLEYLAHYKKCKLHAMCFVEKKKN